ncbi:hypothetical protein ACFVUN_30635 [Kitasatospora griseola]|uniref:hypothetical protein n=1 Tax=Kitasatospora griseola TaxID=2064 RepID=UPI0036D767E5
MTATATATAAAARACPRWDCSAEPVAPQPDSGRAGRRVVAGTCSRWDCLPEPAAPATEFVATAPTRLALATAAPTLELVA